MIYRIGMNTHNELFRELDGASIFKMLCQLFNTTDREQLEEHVRLLVKDKVAFEALCASLKIDSREMFLILYSIFPIIFENKKTINSWKNLYGKKKPKRIKDPNKKKKPKKKIKSKLKKIVKKIVKKKTKTKKSR